MLASSSRYRRELLQRLRLAFDVASPAVDETALPGEAPGMLAARLAQAKARAVALQLGGDTWALGSDQVAEVEGRALGKPGGRDAAIAQLDSMSGRVVRFHTALCRQVGPLPPPRVLNIDHGRQRFLLFAIPRGIRSGACTAPALAFLDAPVAGKAVAGGFEVSGWAFKDGVGLRGVEVMLDGRVVAQARYGETNPGVTGYWKDSNDRNHPNVYFRARVEGAQPGARWLGLRLHGADGSVEDWPEQKIEVR